MKTRDVVGRKIVGVKQERVTAAYAGRGDTVFVWDLQYLLLDNGKRLIFMAEETEAEPIVTAWVAEPKTEQLCTH